MGWKPEGLGARRQTPGTRPSAWVAFLVQGPRPQFWDELWPLSIPLSTFLTATQGESNAFFRKMCRPG